MTKPRNARLAAWGNLLRVTRIARELTQAQLAEALGVTPQSVSSWEKGLTAPRDDQKLAIAEELRADVAHLFPLKVAS